METLSLHDHVLRTIHTTTPIYHASAHIHTSHFFPPQAAVRPHTARPLTPHCLRPFIPPALGDDLLDACHGGETGGGAH